MTPSAVPCAAVRVGEFISAAGPDGARLPAAPDSIAFWDNRATWHSAQNDYQGERRLMHRITVAGCALQAATAARG